MKCPNCQKDVELDSKFCQFCGQNLEEVFCSQCGKEIPSESKFCRNCGSKIERITSKDEEKVGGEETLESTKETQINHSAMTGWKLAILSIVTFGIYELIWAEKQWKALKDIKKLNITPWARGLFIVIFAYSLFKQWFGLSKEKGKTSNPSPILLLIVYIIFIALYRLPQAWWVLSVFSFVPLLYVQEAINYYWEKKEGVKPNNNLSGWEVALIVIGSIIFIFAVLSSLTPE